MRDGLLIRWRGSAASSVWLRLEPGRPPLPRAGLPRAADLARAPRILVLVPGEWVNLGFAALPARRVDAARRAIGFAVEEQLAAPVENLHVAIAESPQAGEWPYAAIGRDRLKDLLEILNGAGVRADAVVADVSLLPEGAIWREGDHILARPDGRTFVAIEASTWAALAVRIGAGAAEPVDQALLRLAARLVECNPINLLQGEFAPAHRRAQARGGWRWLVGLAAAALVLGVGVLGLETWRLQRRVDALRAAMVDVYRERFPDAQRVPQPRAMLDNALAAAGAGDRDTRGGLGLLAQAAPVFAAQTQVQLTGIDFRDGQLELRVRAENVGVIDAVREQIDASATLSAELDGANTRDGVVEGRIRIGAQS